MTYLGLQDKRCIFCEQPIDLNRVAWMIDESRLRKEIFGTEEAQGINAFWDAISRFSQPDRTGADFYAMMSGTQKNQSPRRIPVVLPEHLRPSQNTGKESPNIYTTQTDEKIPIFQHLDPASGDRHLRFTKQFVRAMQESGLECFQIKHSRCYIEEKCIRPVCPGCMSYVPKELLDESDQNTYVARLAYIGPIGSGKTTLNWTNLVFDAFYRGGWFQDVEDLYTTTHYLARNFYETLVQEKKLPPRTRWKEYNPPLLVRLRRKNKKILLVLIDVAGELLQQISQQRASGEVALQTYAYTKVIRQVDGFLLMLDSDVEILPQVGIVDAEKSDGKSGDIETPPQVESPDAEKSDGKSAEKELLPVTLFELVQSYTSNGSLEKKPAALVLTKCDTMFKDSPAACFEEKYENLFSQFSPVERAFWQRPEGPEYIRTSYEADYHECIQFPFKALVQELFPRLWDVLKEGFSRVDIFPEASLGIRTSGISDENTDENSDKKFDLKKLKPFRTAAPIFWLLDMIDFGQQTGS